MLLININSILGKEYKPNCNDSNEFFLFMRNIENKSKRSKLHAFFSNSSNQQVEDAVAAVQAYQNTADGQRMQENHTQRAHEKLDETSARLQKNGLML